MHNYSRSNNLFLGKMFEQAERFEEMAEVLKEIAQSNVELTSDERSLLSVAYKNIMFSKRASWRIVSSLEGKHENTSQSGRIRNFRIKITNEILQLGNEVLQLLDQHLIPSSQSNVSLIFFHKMKGDYYRYMAELFLGDEDSIGKKATENSLEAYSLAKEMAEKYLPVTDPLRLGLILNFSIFYTEILNNYEEGMLLAKKAFEDALPELDTLSEESFSETTKILQLLR